MVAVDATADGRRALRHGIDLARSYDAPLRLVHVRHDTVVLAPTMPLFPEQALEEMAARMLHEALHDTRWMRWKGEKPETGLARPPRVPAIVDHSGETRCVVVGRRSSQAQHLFTASTTSGLAAHSTVPVMCVPESSDAEVRFDRVTVGVDCSDTSAPLVEAAAEIAHDLGAHVVVLHAWRPVGLNDAAIGGRAFEDRWEQQTRPFIDRLVDPVLVVPTPIRAAQ